MKAPLLEESMFATMFPQYREQYIREVWPVVTRELQVRGPPPLASRGNRRSWRADSGTASPAS